MQFAEDCIDFKSLHVCFAHPTQWQVVNIYNNHSIIQLEVFLFSLWLLNHSWLDLSIASKSDIQCTFQNFGLICMCFFVAHLRWKFKWAFLIACCPSSVCLSLRPSDPLSWCKLFTFSSSSPEPLGQFQPNLAQSILGGRGFKFFKMKCHTLSKGGG